MSSRKPLALFRVWDVILIVILLALVALAVYLAVSPEKGDSAEIYVDGELYKTLSLRLNTTVELAHLTVVVEDGSVRVEDADCSDKICEKRGAISKAGQSIVCLPNRVVVKISGKDEVEAIS